MRFFMRKTETRSKQIAKKEMTAPQQQNIEDPMGKFCQKIRTKRDGLISAKAHHLKMNRKSRPPAHPCAKIFGNGRGAKGGFGNAAREFKTAETNSGESRREGERKQQLFQGTEQCRKKDHKSADGEQRKCRGSDRFRKTADSARRSGRQQRAGSGTWGRGILAAAKSASRYADQEGGEQGNTVKQDTERSVLQQSIANGTDQKSGTGNIGKC